jgi:hypothetical protein
MASTVALTYNGYVTQIGTLAVLNTQIVGGVVQGVDSYFNNLIPQMLNYAELRIQRDLGLSQSVVVDDTDYSLTAGSSVLVLPVNAFQSLQTILWVSGTARTPILPTSKDFIANVYGDTSVQGPPQYFAVVGGDLATTGATSQLVLFGPTPDQSYPLHITGPTWFQSLNQFNTNATASTTTTFISAYLSDLLLMASMIYLSGFQRNFSASGSDPAMPVNYEQQYKTLLAGAQVQDAQRKFQASGWTSMPPAPVASEGR